MAFRCRCQLRAHIAMDSIRTKPVSEANTPRIDIVIEDVEGNNYGNFTIARDFRGAATGDNIFLFAQDSEVCFDNFEIAPLSEE